MSNLSDFSDFPEIIHIAGASGSGKTTISKKLKEKGILSYDLDDLFEQFIKNTETKNESLFDWKKKFTKRYQKWLDKFIEKLPKNKIIVIVGINIFIQKEEHLHYWKNQIIGRIRDAENIYFDIHAKHFIYLYVSIDKIIQQKFDRGFINLLDHFRDNKNLILKNFEENEEKERIRIVNIFKLELEDIKINKWKQETEKWNKYYKEKGYSFLNQEEILNLSLLSY